MPVERESLRRWYLDAMGRRIEELRALRDRMVGGDVSAHDAARRVAQELRGSGGTFGYPELSAVAELVETAPDSDSLRRVEGLIEYLRRLRQDVPVPSGVSAEWLARAAGALATRAFASIDEAWTVLGSESGLGQRALAERAAAALGCGVADLSRPARSALRLVPEALMRAAPVVPVSEDGETVTVATADPTSLVTELQLSRLTGRRPVHRLAPPQDIEHALAGLLDHAAADGSPRRRVVSAGEVGSPHEGKVLVVDDDAASRLLARAVLEKNGHAVLEAANGAEALDRLAGESAVGLVVADLNMPELDGLELIWGMRDAPAWRDIPVIVLTGETDELLETKLIEEGADDYLSKPIDPRLFIARVGATIRRAEKRAEE